MNVLKIYTLNEDGTSSAFPNEYEQAEFDDYEYTASRMGGAPSITAKIKHRLCLDNLWTEKQYVEFRGCKYFVRDTPSSSKDNNDTRYEHDITFLHERFVLENVYMLDSVFTDEEYPDAQPETDKYVSNSTKVVFWGDVHEFVGRFNACLYAAGLQRDYQTVVRQEIKEYGGMHNQSGANVTVKINNDETITIQGGGNGGVSIQINCNLILWHKYFVRKGNIKAYFQNDNIIISDKISSAETSGILTVDAGFIEEKTQILELVFEGRDVYDFTVAPLVVDLTELYGRGNEPETAEEFAARLGYSSPDEIPAIKFGKTETIGVFKGYKVVVDEGVTSEEALVAFEDKYFSEALQEIFNIFKLPYYWVGNCCHIGLAPEELSEVFEYGAENALLSIEKQNNNQGYCNRATGVGSSDNIPYYYPNVQAPDVTIPHAVEGNKGITEDSSFSLIADENAMRRWNDMESVADNESPWVNRGIAYRTGSPNGIVFENYWMLSNTAVHNQVEYETSIGVWNAGRDSERFRSDWWYKVTEQPYHSLAFFTRRTRYLYTWSAINNHYRPYDWMENLGIIGDAYRYMEGSTPWNNCKFTFPFKFTSAKGGVRVKIKIQIRELLSPQGCLLSLSSVSFFSAPNAVCNIISFEPDSSLTYTLEVEIFDNVQNEDLQYLDVYISNETAKSSNQEGFYLYKAYVGTPKVSAVEGRWYKEPLNSLSDLFYHRDLSYWGLASTQTPVNGDRIVRKFKKAVADKIIPVSNVLMPTIYRNTTGAESFYNALNEKSLILDEKYKGYKEFYKGDNSKYLEFEHEFVQDNPRETKYTFEDIKPTIKGMTSQTIVDGKNVPMNVFLDAAYDNADNDYLNVDDDQKEAKYAHSYFFVKLPKTTTNAVDMARNFNLFACADENGNDMVLSVTSGSCGGCNFKVMVDEKTRSKNPVLVDGNGNLLRDGNGNVLLVGNKNAAGYTYQDIQQDTSTNEVWIALEKEADTYAIIMPNVTSNLRVVKNDSFVILNIHLPLAYIQDAEDRLSKAIIAQMQKDNSERFSFNISFSRVYMEDNPIIASSLTENAKVYVRYDGLTIPLYVNNYSFKMSSGSPLPEISVDLNDEIAIGSNYSQNRQGDISEPLSTIMGGAGTVLPIITSTDKVTKPSDGNIFSALYAYQNFVSKTKDDTIAGLIHFLQSITVDGSITSGYLKTDMIEIGEYLKGIVGSNRGAMITPEGDIYAKNIYIEESLSVPTVKFNRIMGILGYFIISMAGGKVKEVEKDLLTDDDNNTLYQQVDADGNPIYDANGNALTTTDVTGYPLYEKSGWVTLDLESGEIGSVAIGDMLIGFWHDFGDNSLVDMDGDADGVRNGDIAIRGFQSVYFYVDKIDENVGTSNSRFHYILRSEQEPTWEKSYHPQPEMFFYGFGNQIDEDRQSITIMSREYTVRLIDKSTWRYDESNIIEIHGKLDGFSMFAENDRGETYVKRFTGYGNVIGNSYIFGKIDQFERVSYKMEIDTGGDTFIGVGETKTLTFTVIDGYGVEQTPVKWSVTRSSNKTNDDKVWNAQHKDFSGILKLTLADDFYGIDRATFTVIATMSDKRTAEMIVEM